MTVPSIEESRVRLAKLKQLKQAKINPYPSWGEKRLKVEAILGDWLRLRDREEMTTLAGRLRSLRAHGGSTFGHLEDDTGRLQIYFKKDEVGEESYHLFQDTVDVGDFLAVSGTLFETKKGEKTLLVKTWQVLTKTLLPLPEKWHGLEDVEIRYRQRYLDLLANPEVKAIAKKRSLLMSAIRDFFETEGFMEVETPILQPIYGGASARPFVTHHQALNSDFYLRVSPELYLKRLLVGGFEKVFEIARCFRNEGIDYSHNPEFTQIEFYWAYATYEDLMKLMEKFFAYLLPRLGLPMKIEYRDNKIDFAPPFPRKTFREILIEYAKLDIENYPDADSLYHWAKKEKIEVKEGESRGHILDAIFKARARPKIINPLFMTDHPVDLSPLAKRRSDNSNYTERVQLLLGGGIELGNGWSELNDPLDQEERFKEQERFRQKGQEAQAHDADFVEALKHGLPPAAGLGMGIDRLTALLTNSRNLKEVILFPTLKPK